MKVAAEMPALLGPRPFAFSPGECPIAGYVIRDGLGQSELRETYLAEDAAGRRFVLRRLRRDAELTRARLEQLAGRKFVHLVKSREVANLAAGEIWLEREYLTGWSLTDILAARDLPMPLKDATRWVKGIVAGLHELEACDTVHGRLTPNNVWLERGVVKLVDGSAERNACPTDSRYAAPETAAGRFDKADLYALGAMLVEMLAGQPFNPSGQWQAWLAEPYRSPLARALDPDPARRWASFDEFLAALDATPPNLSRPFSPVVREFMPLRGQTASVVVWAALAAALLILAIALSLMGSATLPPEIVVL